EKLECRLRGSGKGIKYSLLKTCREQRIFRAQKRQEMVSDRGPIDDVVRIPLGQGGENHRVVLGGSFCDPNDPVEALAAITPGLCSKFQDPVILNGIAFSDSLEYRKVFLKVVLAEQLQRISRVRTYGRITHYMLGERSENRFASIRHFF